MSPSTLVPEGTLTLPYGVLQTVHNGASEVRVYRDLITGARQVGKRLSLLGRENNVITEVSVLRDISHPNIADVFVISEVAGKDPLLRVVEIMMPLYEQGSVLDAMIRDDRVFSVGEARDIVVRALRGLVHLHDQHRMLHRDIKPANLFLSSDGSIVKVGDFGETMRMDDAGTADPLLSPQLWTPPETFVGQRYGVTSDIYSMGLTLHELLSGHFPYIGYDVDTLATRLGENRSAVFPRHLRPQSHVPRALQRIVRKAANLVPTNRYRTADEMLQALLRANFIDWAPPAAGDDLVVWRGTYRNKELKMSARPVRGKGWRARCEHQTSGGWRQVRRSPTVDDPDPFSAAATVFLHMDRHKLSL